MNEYNRYLETKIFANGSKMGRPRVSCETLLKLAIDNGLTGTYTNVEGHWSSKDNLWKLNFAHVGNECGQIKLQPVLAVIAWMSECSTEEQIKDWVAAIRSN
ncbi:hypothetical protein BC941DRAFT_465520 [Chlamydoabsidia padenii]|nr:hypothetical protein BC941DRAFT_465520 [Chlamydoabsidia padenii]